MELASAGPCSCSDGTAVLCSYGSYQQCCTSGGQCGTRIQGMCVATGKCNELCSLEEFEERNKEKKEKSAELDGERVMWRDPREALTIDEKRQTRVAELMEQQQEEEALEAMKEKLKPMEENLKEAAAMVKESAHSTKQDLQEAAESMVESVWSKPMEENLKEAAAMVKESAHSTKQDLQEAAESMAESAGSFLLDSLQN